MYKLYCRIYQFAFRITSYLMPWRQPELLDGQGSLKRLAVLLKNKGIDKVLIVTDSSISRLGLMDDMLEAICEEGVGCVVYDKTVPNPTIDNIEQALKIYKDNGCSGIVAFGGGSPMDCAKGVGARIARPRKTIQKLKGLLKVRKRIPLLCAVPTTAGTGSEATIAAVVTDSKTHEKYAINDLALIPHYAIHDPSLTAGLPPHITATTGMDALTHAIEVYIGRSNTKQTKEYSRRAVKMVYENLYEAYKNPTNMVARENMQKAAYYAGIAFTRAYVGYVHAIAHTFGGFYGTPHGLANAIILPYVLEYFGESVHKPLAELAGLVGIGKPDDSQSEMAHVFIRSIKWMNESMGIGNKIEGIVDSDIPLMIQRALSEANPLYPVPQIWDEEDMRELYEMIKA